MSRFASITADLLVRKGQTHWFNETPVEPAQSYRDAVRAPAAPVTPMVPAAPKPAAAQPVIAKPAIVQPETSERPADAVRRCSIRLTECDYKRLGFIAVKKDISRQHLLHLAVEEYINRAEREFGTSCGCLAGPARGRD